MKWTYGIFPRTGGPGSEVVQNTPTAGILAIVYKFDVACLTAEDVPTPHNPVPANFEVVLDLTPMLSVGRQDHTATGGDQDSYAKHVNEVFAVFNGSAGNAKNPGVTTSEKEILDTLRVRFSESHEEFGDEINFDALDSLDLSEYPIILERFRTSYYAMFETYSAFSEPFWDVVGPNAGGRWNHVVMDEIYDRLLSEPLDSPLHTMERWYWHACAVACIPPLEAHLA